MQCQFPQTREIRPGVSFKHRCGQCASCRITRREEWVCRILMEARLHSVTSWTTLTYGKESLPPNGTLQKRDVQLLHKRLRRSGLEFRYFIVGEYGSKKHRPHYHGIYFGLDPSTLEAALSRHWPHGYTMTREFNAATARYTAKYTLKGTTNSKDWYTADEQRSPEFSMMSRNPGIGADYLPRIIQIWKSTPLEPEETGNVIRIDGHKFPLDNYCRTKLLELAGKEPAGAWSAHFKQRIQALRDGPQEEDTSFKADTNARGQIRRALRKETL